MKKKKRRDRSNKSALDPALNLKTRQELLDFDYLHKLSKDELNWLNRAMEEYVSAQFQHDGERIHPKVKTTIRQKSGKTKTVDKYKKDCEDRNNARNHCVMSIAKATNKLLYVNSGSLKEEICDAERHEDTMNFIVDFLNTTSKLDN